MDYSEILSRFQDRSGIKNEVEAVRIITAFIEILSERLDPALSKDLANELPFELKDIARSSNRAEEFSLEEFYTRMSIRADIPRDRIISDANDVMLVLEEALNPGDVQKIVEYLPGEYLVLFSE